MADSLRMADSSGIEALRRAILHDAEEIARAELEEARQSSLEELERARQETEAERARILRDAKRDAEGLRRRIGSIAELEGKRRQLEMRERLIREVLDRTLAGLRGGQGAGGRRSSLLRLVLEAARQAGGGRLVVQASAADLELLTPGFLGDVRRELAREGISAELHRSEQPARIVGGAIVVGDEGRIVVDNSLETRMSRQEPTLRGAIWRILSGEAGGAARPTAGVEEQRAA
ncbi:MAG: V-type ATP synthase subunit E [Chloroflexota bacterium]